MQNFWLEQERVGHIIVLLQILSAQKKKPKSMPWNKGNLCHNKEKLRTKIFATATTFRSLQQQSEIQK